MRLFTCWASSASRYNRRSAIAVVGFRSVAWVPLRILLATAGQRQRRIFTRTTRSRATRFPCPRRRRPLLRERLWGGPEASYHPIGAVSIRCISADVRAKHWPTIEAESRADLRLLASGKEQEFERVDCRRWLHVLVLPTVL